MDSNQKAIIGFLLGATAGAIAGLLLAPDAGEETRKAWESKAKRYKTDLDNEITEAISKISKYKNQAQQLVKRQDILN